MRWPRIPIGNVASVVTKGTTPKTLGSGYVKEGFGFLRAQNLKNGELSLNDLLRINPETHEMLSRSKIFAGDCLLSIAGSIGQVALVPDEAPEMNCNQAVAIIRLKPGLLNRFFMYWAQTNDAQMQFAGGKVTGIISNLSLGQIKKTLIPLPPPTEQQKIVELLDQADALRKRRADLDKKAEGILPALFYNMFGDPVSNPMGWSEKPLGHVSVSEINPRCPRNSIADKTKVSFLPMAGVDEVWGRVKVGQVKPYGEVKKGFTYFKDGDVLFAKITPCMENGKAALVSGLKNGVGFGSTEFHVLRAGDSATSEWLYALVRLPVFREMAKSNFTGSAGQQRVPTEFLRNFSIPVPSLELQLEFANDVQMIFGHIERTVNSFEKFENLLSLLLHRAFTGDLTAKWREAHMKELLEEMEIQAKELKLELPV